jgi:hypothetical protein
MKIVTPIILIASVIGCNNIEIVKSKNIEPAKKDTISAKTTVIDSNLWIEDFRAFRDAVYKRDVEKVKTYFDFPIKKEGEGT